MPSPEKSLQANMFTGELVDNRTAKQKKHDKAMMQPKAVAMFDTKTEVALAKSKVKLLPAKNGRGKPLSLALMIEDHRTAKEIEEAQRKTAEKRTKPMFPEKDEKKPEPKQTPKTKEVRKPDARYTHYQQVKKQFPKRLVFFQNETFYEAFDADAEVVARELSIVLGSRTVGDMHVPKAGMPKTVAEEYINRLLEKGYDVAVCTPTSDGGLTTDTSLRAPHHIIRLQDGKVTKKPQNTKSSDIEKSLISPTLSFNDLLIVYPQLAKFLLPY